MKRAILLTAFVLGGCMGELPVRDELHVEMRDDGKAQVTVESMFTTSPKSQAIERRVDEATAKALTGTDPWTVRFQHVSPEAERTTFERRRGKLEGVIHSARMSEDELQKLLSDTSVTVQVMHGDGWSELSIYPGTSMRPTREQRLHFEQRLDHASELSAHYFAAMHHLYSYLDENPGRAQYVFASLLDERDAAGAPVQVGETEDALLNEVRSSILEAFDFLDEESKASSGIAEEADLIFNAIPGRLSIRVPGPIVSFEGFARESERELKIEPIDIVELLSPLEGKWLTPDPLAMMIHAEHGGPAVPKAAELAAMPRESHVVVTASDVKTAIMAKLARSQRYAVRWRGEM